MHKLETKVSLEILVLNDLLGKSAIDHDTYNRALTKIVGNNTKFYTGKTN